MKWLNLISEVSYPNVRSIKMKTITLEANKIANLACLAVIQR